MQSQPFYSSILIQMHVWIDGEQGQGGAVYAPEQRLQVAPDGW